MQAVKLKLAGIEFVDRGAPHVPPPAPPPPEVAKVEEKKQEEEKE